MSKWILTAILFLFGSRCLGQVGKETTYWEFIKDDPKTKSICTIWSDEGAATGFVASYKDQRVVLTAAHVVYKVDLKTYELVDEVAETIMVCFRGGKVTKATVHAKDLENDVCWLDCEIPEDIPALPVSETDARPGDVVQVIGLGGLSTTSAAIRNFKAVATTATGEELVADTSLIPGDSGGAILNESGEVVSLVSGGWTWQKDRSFTTEDGRPISVTWPCRGANTKHIRKLLGGE